MAGGCRARVVSVHSPAPTTGHVLVRREKGVEELGWQGEKLENGTGRRWVLGKAVDETMHRESRIYLLDEQ